MWHRFHQAGLLWPTLWALPALAVLFGLGTWQMNRKAWKDGLQTQISARAARQPIPLGQALGQLTATYAREDEQPVGEYSRLRAVGRFDHAQERYLFAPHPQLGPGYHVYTPLILGGHECTRFVVVNRGFVPEALKAPAARRPRELVSAPEGDEVVGLLRFPEKPGSFTPANDVGRNIWFWRDLQGMAKSMELSPKGCPLHFFIDAGAEPANPGGWPRGGTTNLKLPNRHLEYALTWYGLAATLVGVYIAFAVGRLRTRENEDSHPFPKVDDNRLPRV